MLVDRDVALEVELAFQAEGAQREMSELMNKDVLPAAEAAVTLMTEGWRARKFDLFRLLQTSRDASEAPAAVSGDFGIALGIQRLPSTGQWGRHDNNR